MKWIATNIRFPEDMYMDLKIEAARKRVSLAKLVREKVAIKPTYKKARKIKTQKLINDLNKLAKENSKYVPKGKNFSDLLIEMRYEQ